MGLGGGPIIKWFFPLLGITVPFFGVRFSVDFQVAWIEVWTCLKPPCFKDRAITRYSSSLNSHGCTVWLSSPGTVSTQNVTSFQRFWSHSYLLFYILTRSNWMHTWFSFSMCSKMKRPLSGDSLIDDINLVPGRVYAVISCPHWGESCR